MVIKGRNIYFGLDIEDISFQNLISRFRNKLISQGLCPDIFFPIEKLHITLLKINLKCNILDNGVFNQVSKILKTTANEFAGKTIKVKSGRYFYGKNSNSVKLYFHEKSQVFLKKLRKVLIKKIRDQGLVFTDDEDFHPHVSLISDFNGFTLENSHIPIVKNTLYELNQIENCFIDIKVINILQPREDSPKSRLDRLLLDESKKLRERF